MKSEVTVARRAAIVWIVLYSWLVHVHAAGIISMSEEARTYDYESLGWAAVFGLMGGVCRTIVSLMSEQFILLEFWRNLRRDLVFALMGGAAMYVLVQALATLVPNIFGKEVRMVCILIAGASRGRWQVSIAGVASDGMANIRAKVRAGAPPPPPSEDPPSTIVVPLSEK
jgi:hypothetical protein